MTRKLSIAGAVLGAALLALGALASASAQTPPTATDPTFLAGRGFLAAHGTGVAAVRGKLAYEGHADDGILLVNDYNGDAHVDVDGFSEKGQWMGFTVYFNLHGHATITGTDTGVILVGKGVDVRVFGKGWAYLKGHGVYRVNGGPLHPWNDDGVFAGIAPDPAATPAP